MIYFEMSRVLVRNAGIDWHFFISASAKLSKEKIPSLHLKYY